MQCEKWALSDTFYKRVQNCTTYLQSISSIILDVAPTFWFSPIEYCKSASPEQSKEVLFSQCSVHSEKVINLLGIAPELLRSFDFERAWQWQHDVEIIRHAGRPSR